jgi:hypothetical protein
MSTEQTPNEYEASTKRLLLTVLYLILARLVSAGLFVLGIAQLTYLWIKERPNEKIQLFSVSLAEFSKEIIEYVGMKSPHKPWPMSPWPSGT